MRPAGYGPKAPFGGIGRKLNQKEGKEMAGSARERALAYLRQQEAAMRAYEREQRARMRKAMQKTGLYRAGDEDDQKEEGD